MQIAHSALSTVGIAGRRVVATGRLDGSSPHTRGTPPRHQDGSLPGRFIPACAGNAPVNDSSIHLTPVHPRMCGERWMQTSAAHRWVGSSPHARGTHARAPHQRRTDRFIPACAGNAARSHAVCSASSVHPRMRGERLRGQAVDPPPDGSSPHARGTLREGMRGIDPGRFIPACAGNARKRSARLPGRAVHPRMRGERCSSCP